MTQKYRFTDSDGQHLHEINVNGIWRPLIGTSAVSGVLNKNLTWWASGLAVREFGCPKPKVLTKRRNNKASEREINELFETAAKSRNLISAMGNREYVDLLDRAYRAHTVKLTDSADEGTLLHAELEALVKAYMRGEPYPAPEKLQPFVAFINAEVADWLWCEVHMYSSKHWLGGISDCGYRRKTGEVGVLDFKSAKDAYPEHFEQCAGYAIQLQENGGFDRDGNQLLPPVEKIDELSVLAFGMKQPVVQTRKDVGACKETFLHTLAIYKTREMER